ncbi:MAG: hypothetical protein MJA83_04160, partial [Gammaproteobacteria bacterium]|nr:hypothetical protein [Gammaproteobacteria bacterium]
LVLQLTPYRPGISAKSAYLRGVVDFSYPTENRAKFVVDFLGTRAKPGHNSCVGGDLAPRQNDSVGG